MTVQNSDAARNARLDAFEGAVGTSPKLQVRTGAQPANCAAAASGTLLAEVALPADWLAAASGGVKSKIGTWSGTAIAAGTAAHYRIVDNPGTTCHEQGSVTGLGGGGDMTVDNPTLAVSQTVIITTYTRTAGNA